MTENLLIQIKNGVTFEHPMTEESLRFFIHNLDINNPPEGYARFIRKPYPELPPHQQLESVEYVLDSELSEELKTPVWTDKFNIRELSEEEIIELTIQNTRASKEIIELNIQNTRASNERMREVTNAPYSAPDDGNLYIWSVSSNTWILMPENFNELVSEFTKKMNELGLSEISLEQLDSIEEDKLVQLQSIIDKINGDG